MRLLPESKIPRKSRSSFIPRRQHKEVQILAFENRTDCTIQQRTILVNDQFMAMMPEIKPCHPVQNDDEIFESSRQQNDQRMFDQPQSALILNTNKHTLNSPILDSEDLFGSCQKSQMFNIQNFSYFHSEKPQPIQQTPIDDIDEFIIGHQTLPSSQPKTIGKKGQSGPFQARFLGKYMKKCLSADTDEKCEMKNQAQNENDSYEKIDINLQSVQRIRCGRKPRRYNYLQLNLITLNPKFLKILLELEIQQFKVLQNVISKEQASKEQLDKAILEMNYLIVFFGWGRIFKFYPGFTEKIILMVVISVLKKLYKLFNLRIINLEIFNQTTKQSYQIPKDYLGEEKLVDEEQEKVQASEKSQKQKHKYDIPSELQKPRELFAKLSKKDYKFDTQKRSKLIEDLKRDREIIFQMIKRLGDKDTKSLLSQKAYKKEFDPSSIFYFSKIEKLYIQDGKLITEDNLEDFEGKMGCERIGAFFQRYKSMVQICSLFYFIINSERNGKPTKKDIEEKVEPLNGEEQKPEAESSKKERKRKTITKEPKTKNIQSESKNLVKSITSRKPKNV